MHKFLLLSLFVVHFVSTASSKHHPSFYAAPTNMPASRFATDHSTTISSSTMSPSAAHPIHQRKQASFMEVSDEETASLVPIEDVPDTNSKGGSGSSLSPNDNDNNNSGGISSTGLKVLILLAVQNSSKNLLMRYVMKEQPKFLTSAAVIGSELTKLTLSMLYIMLVEGRSFGSIVQYFQEQGKNTLLVAVPASAYNLQMTLEYIALANLDAAMFSVLVQTKLLFTATFAALVIGKKLKHIQVISLVLLTVGVMLCNMRFGDDAKNSNMKGILSTLGIAISSGFASVYTEKVIKTQKQKTTVSQQYSLAYTQVQLASMSLVAIGIYACFMDFHKIIENGLFYNFNGGAFLTVFNSAIGGLIVAGVLKYADSVLKGYATAMSVIMTGVLSMFLFGTQLHTVYFMGIINVVVAVLLYNGKNLEQYVCS
jgi:UDP-sugar transporter A1/2/3